MGGSSSINGGFFTRGVQDDFHGWAELGNSEWSWEKVLPFYRRMEDDRDFQNEHHGVNGPIPVARQKPENFSPITEGFIQACEELGFASEPDKNAPGPPGVGPIPFNVASGLRISTAVAYLIPSLARPNLTVRGNALVRRVLLERGRAVGVEVERGAQLELFRAREVVLCAGAIKSPHILMLSGLGPADELRAAGVAVVLDVPCVGKNFMDHPDINVNYQAVGRLPTDPNLPMAQAMLNYTAERSPASGGMEIFAVVTNSHSPMVGAGPGSEARRGRRGVAGRPLQRLRSFRRVSHSTARDEARHLPESELRLVGSLQAEESRGEMRLISADPHVAPELNFHYMSHTSDLRNARANVRLAVEILATKPMRDLVKSRTSPNKEDLQSDAALDRWMLAKIGTAFHTSGTCRMGDANADDSVVDQACRVHGVEGLRVVDTSIMPQIVRRGPNATAIMIGERASEFFG